MSISYHVIQLPLFPTKVCTKCNKEKDLDEFFASKHGKFGKRADCKDCCARPGRPRKVAPSTKPGHKRCNTCLEEKPFEAFKRDVHKPLGYAGRCKQCSKNPDAKLPAFQPPPPLLIRLCSMCGKEKPLEDFAKKRIDGHGRVETCIECTMSSRVPHETTRKFAIYHGVILRLGSRLVIYLLSKSCTKCEKDLPLDAFYIRKGWAKAKCKQCEVDESIEWYKEHPNLVRQSLQRRQANPEYIEYHREKEHVRYNTMPEVRQKAGETNKAYRKANPLKKREWGSRRDGRKQATKTDPISYKHILERDGMWCYICEKDILPHHELAFDHLIPLRPRKDEPQGNHTAENLHPVHKTCNLRKSNKRLEDMTPFDRRGVE